MTERRTKDGWGSRHGKKWSAAECENLIEWRLQSRSWDYIAKTLSRSKLSCQVKHHYETRGGRKYSIDRDQGTPARNAPQGSRTDLTGIICACVAAYLSSADRPGAGSPRRRVTLAPVSMGASP